MGKAALIAIVAFSIVGAYYSMSTQQSVGGADAQLAEQQYEMLARNAALLGFERAKERLAGDFSHSFELSGTYGEHQEASYDVVFERSSSVIQNAMSSVSGVLGTGGSADPDVMVTSVGRVPGPDGRDVEVHLVGVIQKVEVLDIEEQVDVPEFMKYAIVSEDDLALNGSIDLDVVRVEGSEQATYNADIHTNGYLSVQGGAALVRGYGTYVTGQSVRNPESIFQPYDPSGEAVVQQRDAVELPLGFDPGISYTQMQAHFPGQQTTGDLTLSGDYDFSGMGATAEQPYVWYVDGNVMTTGNVTVSGHVVFLVEGDIQFTGNMQAGAQNLAESQMAFYAGGNVNVAGTVDVLNGQFFSKGNFTFQGTPLVEGTIAVGGTADLGGTPDINYLPASTKLTRVFNPTTIQLQLIGYTEQRPDGTTVTEPEAGTYDQVSY